MSRLGTIVPPNPPGAAPLTVASPDVYIDVQNAASMLFRLQRLGVDVSDRWMELACAAGRHADAVDLMRPAIGGMCRLGGSHAQQDVLEQLFVDTALKAGRTADVRLALERVAGLRAIPPERFVGWREAAERVTAL